MKIWKYEVSLTGFTNLKIPEYAEFMCLREQDGVPFVWFLVDLDKEVVYKTLHTYMTGEELPHSSSLGIYLGSFQILGDNHVGHVFEEYS